MTGLVLYPDIQFAGPADIEAAVYGSDFELSTSIPGDPARIADDIWGRAVALVCYHDITVTAELLDRMPRCRVVVRAGVGFDNIDLAAAGSRGIAVCNTPDYGTTDVADHAIGLMLAFLRGIPTYDRAIFDDPAAGWRFASAPTVRRLSTQVFGVIGLGRIGTATALRAKALGMRVVFFDPYRPTGIELAIGVERIPSLEELLTISDVVSLHAPLTPETHHMISRAALAAMKHDAILINTARGGIVDLGALMSALLDGQMAGAALDVLDVEPPTLDHPLLQAWRAPGSPLRSKLLLTPHAAFYSPSSLLDLRRKSAETALSFLRNGWSRDCVNGDLIDRGKAAARAVLDEAGGRSAG